MFHCIQYLVRYGKGWFNFKWNERLIMVKHLLCKWEWVQRAGTTQLHFFRPVRFIYVLVGKRGPVLGTGMVFSLMKQLLVKCCVHEDSQEVCINSFLKRKSMYHGLTTDFDMLRPYPGGYLALHSPSFECIIFFLFFCPCFWGNEFLILTQRLFWLHSTASAALGCAKHGSPGCPVPRQLTSSQGLLSQHA